MRDSNEFSLFLEAKYNSPETRKKRMDIAYHRTDLKELEAYVIKNSSAMPELDKLKALLRTGKIQTVVLDRYGKSIHSLYLILQYHSIIGAEISLYDFEEFYQQWVVEDDHFLGDYFVKHDERVASMQLSGECDMNQLVLAHIYFIAFLQCYNPAADFNGQLLSFALKECMNIICNSECFDHEVVCNFSGYSMPKALQTPRPGFFAANPKLHALTHDMYIESSKRQVLVKVNQENNYLSFVYRVSPEIRDQSLHSFAITLSQLLAKATWTPKDKSDFYLLSSDLMWSHLWVNGNGRLSKLVERCIGLFRGYAPRPSKTVWSGYEEHTLQAHLIDPISRPFFPWDDDYIEEPLPPYKP